MFLCILKYNKIIIEMSIYIMSKYISLKRNIPVAYYIVLVTVMIVSLFLWQMTRAADTDTVAATITPTNLSLTVSSGTITYGSVSLDTSTTTVGSSYTQIVTNTGSDMKLNVKSGDATGGTGWTLNTVNTADNEFTHEVSTTTGSAYMFLPDSSTYITASSTMPTGAVTQDLDFRLTTPQVVGTFDQKSITITVQASSQ